MAQQATATDDGRTNWTRYHKFTKGEKRAEARAERIAASEPETTETTETTDNPTVGQATLDAFETKDEQATKDAARAEWEAFLFIDVTEGWVNVANTSHDDPKSHVYSVEVEDDEAVSCSCKHDTYREGKCKHRRAVESDYL